MIRREASRVHDVGYSAFLFHALLILLVAYTTSRITLGQPASSMLRATLAGLSLGQTVTFWVGTTCALLAWRQGDWRLSGLFALYLCALFPQMMLPPPVTLDDPGFLIKYGWLLWRLPAMALSFLFAWHWFVRPRRYTTPGRVETHPVVGAAEADESMPAQEASDLVSRWIAVTTLGFVLAALLAGLAEAFLLDNARFFPAHATPRVSADQAVPLGLAMGTVIPVLLQATLVFRWEGHRRAVGPCVILAGGGYNGAILEMLL